MFPEESFGKTIAPLIEGLENVNSFLNPVILCFTVLASVGFGVAATYGVVLGILFAFGRSAQPEPQRPRLVLVATQNHASGD
jgi:hypothetical protein